MFYSRLYKCLVLAIFLGTISQTVAQTNKPPQPQPKPKAAPGTTKTQAASTPPGKSPCEKGSTPVCVAAITDKISTEKNNPTVPVNGVPQCTSGTKICCAPAALKHISSAKNKSKNKKPDNTVWQSLCALPGQPIPSGGGATATKPPAKTTANKPPK